MILKVSVHDNDFTLPLRRACEDLLQEVIDGNPGQIDDAKLDLEGLRRALVIGTYGHVIARQARIYRTLYYHIPEVLARKNVTEFLCGALDRLDYIEKTLTVEVIETLDQEPKWSNGEVVYVDFDANTVQDR